MLNAEAKAVSVEDVEFLKDYGDVRLGCGVGCGGGATQPWITSF